MIILIPLNSDKRTICPTFGRAPVFLKFDTKSGGKSFYENPATDASGGAGILAAQFVVDKGADAVITPRCGQNSAQVLKGANVKIFKASSDDYKTEVEKLQNNKLKILTHIHPGFHGNGFK